MSGKASTSDQVISLPKGGGALRGIGEKFSADLHTGTGNLTVPLDIPAGRGGFHPQLQLEYSTGSPNGPFGLGWALSIPGVKRKASHGVPRYDDSHDTFILSGAEDLVAVPGAPEGATRYRPRTEGLFADIFHYRAPSGDYWEVRSKDGLVILYGTPRPSEAGADWRDPATLADPDAPGRIFAWHLTSTTDPFGNRIEYLYERDRSSDTARRWEQLYLASVRYVDHGDATRPRFLVSVDFAYEDRPDPFSDHRGGFEVRTRRRCRSITIHTHPDRTIQVRTYHLAYLDQRVLPPEDVPSNRVSLLSQVQLEGHDGARSELLPPLEFRYTAFHPERRRYQPMSAGGGYMPERSLAHRDYELVDLFSNGLPSVVQMNGTARFWRNRGGGRFDFPRPMRDTPAGVRLEDEGVQIADMDGDGRADLLVTDGTRAGYYSLSSSGTWDQRSFVRYQRAPSINLEAPDVRLVDLDGDGVVDALRTGANLELFYNDREILDNGQRRGWGRVDARPRGSPRVPDVSFLDPRIKLADMTGDGLQDVVLVNDGRIDYWPYQGYGRWGSPVTMKNSPRLRDATRSDGVGYDPKRVLLGDVDGDGCADVVYVGSGQTTLWINQSGNGWTDPLTIHGTPSITDLDAVRLADMNGTGTAGVLWTYDQGAQRDSTFKFLDLTGGIKPYLLSEIDNHLGAVTRIDYAPSTRFYLEDEAHPKTRWKTTLPFPVQVVARVEAIDAVSQTKHTTAYRYHHGYWDGAEREFRGFGRVDQIDSEAFEDFNRPSAHPGTAQARAVPREAFSPPTETRTWFHLGPVGPEVGAWSELDLSGEYWPADPSLFSQPPETARFLNQLSPSARRNALRALRGRVLRTEIYALDGGPRQDRPYTVTEHLYGLTPVPVGEPWPERPEEWRLKVVFPHLCAERTTEWERGDDPLTTVDYTEDQDAYGQPRSRIHVAVPRGRRNPQLPGGTGEPHLATHEVSAYATSDNLERLIADRLAHTTSFEIVNDGSQSLEALRRSIVEGTATKQVIGQTLHFYDGPAFEGLPCGQLGSYGALTRTEKLVITPEVLREAYKRGDVVQSPPEEPPYLTDPSPPWPAEYPDGFRERTPPLAGYLFHAESSGDPHLTRYFAQLERRRHDFQDDAGAKGRGLIRARLDPLGGETQVVYDEYELLPTQVTRINDRLSFNLIQEATYDYRILQPTITTDVNGNETQYAFTPTGLLEAVAVMGKPGEQQGDTPEQPGTTYRYDFWAYETSTPDRRQPVFAHKVIREQHRWDVVAEENERRASKGLPPLPDDEIKALFPVDDLARYPKRFLQSREYSDGFGRLVQARAQADDVRFGSSPQDDVGLPLDQSAPPDAAVGQAAGNAGPPRVVVSGWQVYDNKGRVVEKYEPFYAEGFEYEPPSGAPPGQKVTMRYDPRGRLVRTISPDGSERRIVYGVPGTIAAPDLGDPEVFEPTPWVTFTYDQNDNAGRTHRKESARYQHHWNTPASATIDALGRTVETVERNGPDPANWFTTRSAYNIRGKLVQVTDPLNRQAAEYIYDLLDRPWRTWLLDAGVHRTVLDAAGNALEQRDAKGALVLTAFDGLRRPVRVWARDGSGQEVTLRERLVYGDSADSGHTMPEAAGAKNLLGKVFRHYDEAGLLSMPAYDFKDNVLEKTRQVFKDERILEAYAHASSRNWENVAFRVAWEPLPVTPYESHAAALLDNTAYETSTRYDALNRVTSIRHPTTVNGSRPELRPRYSRAGLLEQVELNGTVYIERIAYNARGQRLIVVYGNGLMTRYAYDPHTLRLARLLTERFDTPAPLTYRGRGKPYQDFGYEYDLSGNLLALHDRTPGSGIPGQPDRLDRTFEYDPLYRLLSATGRECDVPPPPPPWDDTPRCQDVTRARPYTERYEYDAVGNLLQLKHRAVDDSFTRGFATATSNNRLLTMTAASVVYNYHYNEAGSLMGEGTSRRFEWTHADYLETFRIQAGASPPSVYARYFYDPAGRRIKKLITKGSGHLEATVDIDGAFEHCRITDGQSSEESNVVHVFASAQRVAEIRIGSLHSAAGPEVTYHLTDHLGSSNVLVDQWGNLMEREEYSPYGETCFGHHGKKRYRFAGKERDQETGLYYYGARYYAPWLGRWWSRDPLNNGAPLSTYSYVRGRPLTYDDPSGLAEQPSEKALQVAENARVGAVNKSKQLELIETRSNQILVEELTVGRGRLDAVTAKSGKGVRSLEATSMTVWKKGGAYRDVGGSLLEGPIASKIEDKIKQVVKHIEDLRNLPPEVVLKLEKRLGKVPTFENLLITVRGASSAEVGRIRQIAQTVASKLEGIRPGVGVISEKVFGGIKAIAPAAVKAAAEAGQKALKVVPFVGIAAGLYSVQAQAREGNYGTATLDAIGLVPVIGDMVDAGRLGAEVGMGIGERLDRALQLGSGGGGEWYYRTFLK